MAGNSLFPTQEQMKADFEAGERLARSGRNLPEPEGSQTVSVPVGNYTPIKFTVQFWPPLYRSREIGYRFG